MDKISDEFANKFVSALAKTKTTITLNMIELEELTTALVARIKQVKNQTNDPEYFAILKNIIIKIKQAKLDL
jgi:hypothetical protein